MEPIVESDGFDDPVPLSALQHYSYCPRQCALIHVEQVFDENVYTMKGRWAHTKVDEEHVKSANGLEILTALPVWSDRHGLVGKCDVVEMHHGVPRPVEFKHGRREAHVWDEVQLCGQALCLEEMFGVDISEGDIYHISSRRRRKVLFTEDLRNRTLTIARLVRTMLQNSIVPPAFHDQRCVACSLQDACMPERTDGFHRVTWKESLAQLDEEWATWDN
ncbi:CRISPR-associated protein Cas4 [Alicyclobacillus acidiphilus]|uniref:CRISPR-associated protein Cas4 n=1 Tax=Alicyclobacillus acidiphilus TaxID=182455 RepID=UPI001FE14EDE|nr:CRISPR-associated protein Cas4 [Alicyclobacillus acidiphilus]